MGILDAFFGGSNEPSPKRIAATVQVLQSRHGEPIRRYQAADRLAKWGTPDALIGLLRRFTFNAEKDTSDDDEKAHVADLLEQAGDAAIEPILHYLRTEEEVSWPLRVLERLVPEERFRDTLVSILSSFDVDFDRIPQRKVLVIAALEPHRDVPGVADAVAAFLEDTDDRVRIAAIDLLGGCRRAEDSGRLVEALVASEDRPRVRAAVVDAMVANGLSVKGRKAEVEPLLPDGCYLTRDGTVKRLGKSGG